MKHLACILLLAIFLHACTGGGDGTPSATPRVSATAIPTARPGLTDTSYTALDGRPLFAECIAAGAPLPPVLPTPGSGPSLAPEPEPGRDLNAGKERPSGIPALDLREVAPADSGAWALEERSCYGYNLRLPPGWTSSQPFTQTGYQQGESATLRAPGDDAKIVISAYYSPVDYLAIALAPPGIGADEFAIAPPRAITVDGAEGVESYVFVEGELTGVRLSHIVRPAANWYVTASVWLLKPYDERTAQEAMATLRSLTFEP